MDCCWFGLVWLFDFLQASCGCRPGNGNTFEPFNLFWGWLPYHSQQDVLLMGWAPLPVFLSPPAQWASIWGSTDHVQVLLWAKEAEDHSTEDAHCHSLMSPIGFQTWVVFMVRKHGFVSFCLPFSTGRNKLCRVCALHSSSSFPCPLGGHFSLLTLSLAAALCFCMRHPSSARSKSSSFTLLGLFTLIRFGN